MHALQRHGIGRRAAVVGGIGQWMRLPGERDQTAFVDWFDDTRGRQVTLRHQPRTKEQPTSDCSKKNYPLPIKRHISSTVSNQPEPSAPLIHAVIGFLDKKYPRQGAVFSVPDEACFHVRQFFSQQVRSNN
jgi:hypothetical protein